jgi:site-specific DNA recombinase
MTIQVIGYCRVSTEYQRENTSLDKQEADIRDFCRLHNLELVNIVADAESGYGPANKRPAFVRAINYLQTGEAQALVVWKLDRYSRNVKEGLELFSYFEKKGYDLISVRDQINTATPAGRAFFQMALVFAEWERNTIVERVKTGLAVKRARGEFAGGSAPYGWRIEDGCIVLHVEEQKRLERMRRWQESDLMSCKAIAEKLNAEGIPSKRGGLWSDETVRRALKQQQKTLKSERVKTLR